MSDIYSAEELRQAIWEDRMGHVDNCACQLCNALDVISDYLDG
jgi:hypothetical protein